MIKKIIFFYIIMLYKQKGGNILKLENIYLNIDNPIPQFAKLAGVSFEDRQSIIKSLKSNMKLDLKRDYKNKYDKCAIAVYYNSLLIGWIPKYISEKLACEMDFGIEWEAIIKDITGEDKDLKGVNIELICVTE